MVNVDNIFNDIEVPIKQIEYQHIEAGEIEDTLSLCSVLSCDALT